MGPRDRYGWIQPAIFLATLLLVTEAMDAYLHRVLDPRGKTFLDLVLKPVEQVFFRLLRIDPGSEQDWKRYTASLLSPLRRRAARQGAVAFHRPDAQGVGDN